MLDTEERNRARRNIEVGIRATLRAISADAEAIREVFDEHDLPMTVICAMLEDSGTVASLLRATRESVEICIRADAITAAEKVRDDLEH